MVKTVGGCPIFMITQRARIDLILFTPNRDTLLFVLNIMQRTYSELITTITSGDKPQGGDLQVWLEVLIS